MVEIVEKFSADMEKVLREDMIQGFREKQFLGEKKIYGIAKLISFTEVP